MAGIPYIVPGANGAGGSAAAFFVKVAALPASKMTLLDFDLASNGYSRLVLDSTGTVLWEVVIAALSINIALQLNPTTKVSPGVFFFVSVANSEYLSACNFRGVVSASGQTLGDSSATSAGLGGDTSYTARMGIGASVSSSYLNFPNTTGSEMSKLNYNSRGGANNSNGVLGVPTADWTGGTAYYNARQAPGPISTLTDNGPGGYNAAAGPNGLTINTEGPFP